MSRSSRRASIGLAPLFAALVDAVALSDFAPALQGVPDPCGSVYMDTLAGCTSADFPNRCSDSCISALADINRAINAACTDFDAPDQSLIAFFKAGQGIQALCNVVVITQSVDATPPPLVGSSTMVLPLPTGLPSSSLMMDTSVPPWATSSSSPLPSPSPTSSSSSSTTSGLATETPPAESSPPPSSSTPTLTSSSPAPLSQSADNGDNEVEDGGDDGSGDNNGSNGGGGGDPFSIPDTDSAGSVVPNPMQVLGAAFALMIFAVVFG